MKLPYSLNYVIESVCVLCADFEICTVLDTFLSISFSRSLSRYVCLSLLLHAEYIT